MCEPLPIMNKWKLLKNAIIGDHKSNNESRTPDSIHRFDGFQNLIKNKNLVWCGFFFQLSYSSNQTVFSNNNYDPFLNFLLYCQSIVCESDTLQAIFEIEISLDFSERFKQTVAQNSQICCLISYHLKPAILQSTAMIFEVIISCPLHLPLFRESQYLQFFIPFPSCLNLEIDKIDTVVYTREKSKKNVKVDLKDLISNQLHGVDNTGNICVWPSEQILLHTIIHNERYFNHFKNASVLELGGGMTSFCALALSVMNICRRITITDGHPNCIRNQKFCIRMNQNKRNGSVSSSVGDTTSISGNSNNRVVACMSPISSHQLRWSDDDSNNDLKRLLNLCTNRSNANVMPSGCFDVILACDVLFFTDFHDSLIFILRHALIDIKKKRHVDSDNSIVTSSVSSPSIDVHHISSVQGNMCPEGNEPPIVLLLQPRRGQSMQQFINKATMWFNVTIEEDYDAQVCVSAY